MLSHCSSCALIGPMGAVTGPRSSSAIFADKEPVGLCAAGLTAVRNQVTWETSITMATGVLVTKVEQILIDILLLFCPVTVIQSFTLVSKTEQQECDQ